MINHRRSKRGFPTQLDIEDDSDHHDENSTRKRQKTLADPSQSACRMWILQNALLLVAAAEEHATMKWPRNNPSKVNSSQKKIVDTTSSTLDSTSRKSCDHFAPERIPKSNSSCQMMKFFVDQNETRSETDAVVAKRLKSSTQHVVVPKYSTTNLSSSSSSSTTSLLPSGKPLLAPPGLPRVKLGDILSRNSHR